MFFRPRYVLFVAVTCHLVKIWGSIQPPTTAAAAAAAAAITAVVTETSRELAMTTVPEAVTTGVSKKEDEEDGMSTGVSKRVHVEEDGITLTASSTGVAIEITTQHDDSESVLYEISEKIFLVASPVITVVGLVGNTLIFIVTRSSR